MRRIVGKMLARRPLLLLNRKIFKETKFINLSYRRYSANLSYHHEIGKVPLSVLTVGDVLENGARKYFDHPAIVSRYQRKSITFNELLIAADKLAAGLHELGLRKGDRVGIIAPNVIEWEIAFLACCRGGFIVVQINPASQASEIEYCINKVGIKAIISAHTFKSQNFYEIFKEIHPKLGIGPSPNIPSLESLIFISYEHLKDVHLFDTILNKADDFAVKRIKDNQHLVQCDDGCNIQFTSGTTGKPKAALVSHFNCVNNSYFVGDRIELSVGNNKKVCVQVPYFHTFGSTIGILASLHFGATQILPGLSYNPNESLDAIVEHSCNVVYGTPTMYVDLVRVQKERNELISPDISVVGGAPCSPSLYQDIIKTLNVKKIRTVYGLTETTAVVMQCGKDDSNAKALQTIGRVGDHLEAKVVNESGEIVPYGTTGELWIRGYCNMKGYWEDKDKTEETLTSDGWLKTGDTFVLYQDGYGQIIGRIKDMIIRGGENIYPKEVEDFLNSHPDIIESQVVGLPDERLGEIVAVGIRAVKGKSLNLADISEFCKGKIAHFKIPARMKIFQDFPKTSSGKIQKYKLVAMLSK